MGAVLFYTEAAEWIPLGRLDPDTSIVHCRVDLFLIKNLSFTQPQREGTEKMEMVKLSFTDAVQKVMDSTITAGPSCVLLLKAHSFETREGSS